MIAIVENANKREKRMDYSTRFKVKNMKHT